jgi:hypothetical protein
VRDAIVVGGGLLGGAVAHVAADGGARVVVLSRSPRPHPGLWRRFDARTGDLRAAGAAVFVCLSPGPRDEPEEVWGDLTLDVVRRAWTGGAKAVTACVPAGFTKISPATLQRPGNTTVLSYGPLVSADAGCVAPWVKALREGHVARVPRKVPDLWPLVVEDGARAAWRLTGAGGARVLRGRDLVPMKELARLLADRFAGRWGERWVGGLDRPRRDLLRAQLTLPDDWEDTRLGPRTPFATWVDRLAGPRRRR